MERPWVPNDGSVPGAPKHVKCSQFCFRLRYDIIIYYYHCFHYCDYHCCVYIIVDYIVYRCVLFFQKMDEVKWKNVGTSGTREHG